MRRDGLTVESEAHGDIHVPKVVASADPAQIGPVDLVIISLKLWDTEAAARAIAPMVGPGTAVLSLQNGVTKDDILRRVFPPEKVMGGVAYVASYISRPGVIHQTGAMQRIVVGEYDGRPSQRARELHEALSASGVTAELSDDVRRAIWEKYVFLVALSGSTTAMRSTLGPIRENPASRAFFIDLMREVVRVGRALGVALPEDYADQRVKFMDGLPVDMTSSMHHDLEAGNRLEVPWLSGGVVALGEQAGVPTPANRAVSAMLALYADGKRGKSK
jgi:2-dehydropantoate 2-reductase